MPPKSSVEDLKQQNAKVEQQLGNLKDTQEGARALENISPDAAADKAVEDLINQANQSSELPIALNQKMDTTVEARGVGAELLPAVNAEITAKEQEKAAVVDEYQKKIEEVKNTPTTGGFVSSSTEAPMFSTPSVVGEKAPEPVAQNEEKKEVTAEEKKEAQVAPAPVAQVESTTASSEAAANAGPEVNMPAPDASAEAKNKTPEEVKKERQWAIVDEFKKEWEAKNGPLERQLTKKEIEENKMFAEKFGKQWDGSTTQLTDEASEFIFDHKNGGKDSIFAKAEKTLKERFPEYDEKAKQEVVVGEETKIQNEVAEKVVEKAAESGLENLSKSELVAQLESAKKEEAEWFERTKTVSMKEQEVKSFDHNVEYAKNMLAFIELKKSEFESILDKSITINTAETANPESMVLVNDGVSSEGEPVRTNEVMTRSGLVALIYEMIMKYGAKKGYSENPNSVFRLKKNTQEISAQKEENTEARQEAQEAKDEIAANKEEMAETQSAKADMKGLESPATETTLRGLFAEFEDFLTKQINQPKPTAEQIDAVKKEADMIWDSYNKSKKKVEAIEAKIKEVEKAEEAKKNEAPAAQTASAEQTPPPTGSPEAVASAEPASEKLKDNLLNIKYDFAENTADMASKVENTIPDQVATPSSNVSTTEAPVFTQSTSSAEAPVYSASNTSTTVEGDNQNGNVAVDFANSATTGEINQNLNTTTSRVEQTLNEVKTKEPQELNI